MARKFWRGQFARRGDPSAETLSWLSLLRKLRIPSLLKWSSLLLWHGGGRRRLTKADGVIRCGHLSERLDCRGSGELMLRGMGNVVGRTMREVLERLRIRLLRSMRRMRRGLLQETGRHMLLRLWEPREKVRRQVRWLPRWLGSRMRRNRRWQGLLLCTRASALGPLPQQIE